MIKIPVPYGELVDKVSILKIKSEKIKDPDKLKHILHELELLSKLIREDLKLDFEHPFFKRLYSLNSELWVIEDQLRKKENEKKFDGEFIILARKVYRTNDERCRIKKEIDAFFKSEISEQKSYEKYD